MMNRRSLITGLISLVAAPAIVRAESLMPVRAVDLFEPQYTRFSATHPTKEGARLLARWISDSIFESDGGTGWPPQGRYLHRFGEGTWRETVMPQSPDQP
jgi:hypothetical protein